MLSSFKDILCLAIQSRHKFGNKCDAYFNVYLILNLPRFRNSMTDLYGSFNLKTVGETGAQWLTGHSESVAI